MEYVEGYHKVKNGEFLYLQEYFTKEVSDFYLQEFLQNIAWSNESIKMFGKTLQVPRLTAWYGDSGKDYSYSGIKHIASPWTNALLEIKAKLSKLTTVNYNSVLLNLYRNGKDSMGWHQDNEKELGKNPIIASVSFGATRQFSIRHIKNQERINLDLGHGSVLVMMGEMQHFWQHQVPKTKIEKSERVNLTYRDIK